MRSIFTPDDYDDMLKYLSNYQKKQADWDSYRGKIPDDLLGKFKRVLDECRANGFIAPAIRDSKIMFRQILRQPNSQPGDQCTLCQNSFHTGTCKGHFERVNGRRDFVLCWKGKT